MLLTEMGKITTLTRPIQLFLTLEIKSYNNFDHFAKEIPRRVTAIDAGWQH